METSMAAGEDKKPELKCEPKEEDVGSGTSSTPAVVPNKKKSENIFQMVIYIQDVPRWFDVEFNDLLQPPTIGYSLKIWWISWNALKLHAYF